MPNITSVDEEAEIPLEDALKLMQAAVEEDDPAEEPEAPPKRAPREPRKTPQDKPRTRTRKTQAAAAPKMVRKGLSKDARVQGIQGFVQLAAGGCMIMSRVAPGDGIAFQADAVTLASSADQIAVAVADTCAADERFARVVDRICTVGPYGALLQVALGVGMQIARNHGAPVPGQDPQELVNAYAQAQEQQDVTQD